VLIAVLCLFFVIYSLYRSHQNAKWKLINSSSTKEEFFQVLDILSSESIGYKVHHPTPRKSHYDIYVKIDDEVRAIYLLQTVILTENRVTK